MLLLKMRNMYIHRKVGTIIYIVKVKLTIIASKKIDHVVHDCDNGLSIVPGISFVSFTELVIY